jgi:uncharacterized membrane protein YfcA
MSALALLLFGAVVGVLSGVLGIGGGVVLVPGLILLFGFSQPEAQGTSLAVMIPPIGIFAALVYYQHGFVRVPVVSLIALGFLLGAFGGAKLVPLLPVEWMRLGFGILLLYVGLVFVLDIRPTHPQAALPAAIATTIAVLVGRVLRKRWRVREKLEPPSAEHEYHI